MTTPINAMRHIAIHNPNQYQDKRIAVIGVGTIGSHLAHTLARMQVPMALYDHDTIEEHNLATQTYGVRDIGKPKVRAVEEQIRVFNATTPLGIKEGMFERGDEQGHDLIVSCVDSLEARRGIAVSLIEAGCTTPIVDGRVGQEQVEVYHFPTAKEWLAQLPEEGDDDPCGARFTAYTANIAAGLIANNVKRFLTKQKIQGRIIYDAASSTFLKE